MYVLNFVSAYKDFELLADSRQTLTHVVGECVPESTFLEDTGAYTSHGLSLIAFPGFRKNRRRTQEHR